VAIEFKRTQEDVRTDLTRIATQYGYTRLDRFIGAFVDVFTDIYGEVYNELYSLEDQMRVDTATGEFLNAWGILLDEPRERTQSFEDLSFDNVYITTSNNQPVTQYTVGGTGLLIPNGTKIVNEANTHVMSVIDTVLMQRERIFVRVVGSGNVTGTIPAGTYSLSGSINDFVIPRLPDAAAGIPIIDVPNLEVVVQRPVQAQDIALDDSEYRFILYSKARSINLANKEKIDTLLGDRRIARFVIKQFTSGSSSVSIYIEPTTGLLEKPLEQSIKLAVDKVMPYGTVVHASRMVGSNVEIRLGLSLLDTVPTTQRDTIKANVSTALIRAISNLRSGSTLIQDDLEQTAEQVSGVGDVQFREVKINGLTLYNNIYTMKDIEYVFAADSGIIIEDI